VCKRDFSEFFNQWVNRKGAPTLSVENVKLQQKNSGYQLTFTIAQSELPFSLSVPVVVETPDSVITTTVDLDTPHKTVTLDLKKSPISLKVDPDFDCFRKLHPEEIPPTLGMLFAQDTVAVVIGSFEDSTLRESLEELANIITRGRERIKLKDGIQLPAGTIWLLGRGKTLSKALERLPIKIGRGKVTIGEEVFDITGSLFVCTLRSPFDGISRIGIIICDDTSYISSIGERLPHYSRYSYIIFKGSKPTIKRTWEIESSPLIVRFDKRQKQ